MKSYVTFLKFTLSNDTFVKKKFTQLKMKHRSAVSLQY